MPKSPTMKAARDLKPGDTVTFGAPQPDRKIAEVAVDGDFVHVRFDDEIDGHLSAPADALISLA